MTIDADLFLSNDDLEADGWRFASGTKADSSRMIYFPETYNSSDGHVLVLDPYDGSSNVIRMGSGMGYRDLGHGHAIPGTYLIVYVLDASYNANEKELYFIDWSTSDAWLATITGTNVSTGCTSSVLHSNGYLYTFRSESGATSGTRITKINLSTLAATSVVAGVLSNTQWDPAGATEGSDGRIYCAQGFYHWQSVPGSNPLYHNPPILIYDPSDDSWSYEHMGLPALEQEQFWADGIAMPDGSIYFVPGIYFDSDPQPYPVLIVDPSSGTASLGADVPSIVFRFGVDPPQRLVKGAAGRIYYTGQDTSDPNIPVLVAFNPVGGGSYETWSSPPLGSNGWPPAYALAVDEDGIVWGAPGTLNFTFGPSDIVNYLVKIIDAATVRWSFAVGSTPVTLALGAGGVSGAVG